MDFDLVFSTNPDWRPEEEPQAETLPPSKQTLKIRMERKGRGGKTAIIVSGFIGNNEDLLQLAKTLKTACGVGGSAKDGEIIIQGNCLDKVREKLHKEGYTVIG